MSKDLNRHPTKRIYTDGKWPYENLFHIIYHWGNAN